MATVYSLVCFGGKDGKTVTLSIATPCVASLTNHGLRDGTGVVFSTTGALPTGVTAGTTYYSRSTAISTFNLYDTAAHAIAGGATGRVNTSGTQSGTHTIKGAYYSGLTTDQKNRYGGDGSLIYNGIKAWRDARYSAAVATDIEYCEIGEAFIDYLTTAAVAMNVPAAQVVIVPEVDGVKSGAYHGGVIAQRNLNGSSVWIPDGYIVDQKTYYVNGAIELSGVRHEISGISFSTDQQNTMVVYAPATGLFNKVEKCMVFCYGSTVNVRIGLHHRQDTLTFANNRIYGFTGTSSMGLQVYGYDAGNGSVVACNTVTNCTTGFGSANTGTSPKGWYYNNISLGNTTNWGTSGTGSMHGVGYNAGLSGEAWGTTGRVTMATTDFADYANYDFTPALSSSPQVDTGTTVIGMTAEDIIGNTRPNYNAGTTEVWDIGADEFDHGLTPPAVRNLVIPTLVSGSQVQIFTTGTTTALTGSTNSSGTSLTQDMGADMTVDVTVMKAGYRPLRFAGIVLDSTTYTLLVDQELDRAYVASSDLVYTTNATIDRTNKEVAINIDSTLQNCYSFWIETWIALGDDGAALANLDFPFSTNGPNSFTLENGWVWEDWGGGGTGSASIAHLSRDGMRCLNTSGNVVKAWAAIYTPDTGAGLQVQIEQVNGGSIVAAQNTGPMDQLVQIIDDPNGDGSYGDGYDYTGHLQLRVQAVGYTKPLADVYATFGTLEDQLYSIGLAPAAQWPCTDAPVANITWDFVAKESHITADMVMQAYYQGGQYETNQDAQWDSVVPVSSVDGNTYTQESAWTMYGIEHITDSKTLAGGALVVVAAPSTLTTVLSGLTMEIPAAGTYTFTAANVTISATPTSASNYVLSGCTFTGSNLFWNTTAHNMTVEIPAGATFASTGSPGAGTVTFIIPQVYQTVTVSGLTVGSRVQIYDTTSSTELANAVADSGNIVFSSGGTVATWTDPVAAAADRAIRLRITYCAAATADIMIDKNIGTCGQTAGTAAVSYLHAPEVDAVYVANAVDGSGVTGMTIDDSNFLLEIASGSVIAYGGVDVVEVEAQDMYAFETYWLFTEEGIRDEARFIDAIDGSNYEFASFLLKNTTTGPVYPILVVNGYVRDAATGKAASMVDYSGGPIHFAPDHVVNNIVTVGGVNIITGDIGDIPAAPSAATISAQVLSDAATTPIAADMKKANGTAIKGDGTAGDKFRSTLVA